MSKKKMTRTKLMERYLIKRIMLAEANMMQWAIVDHHLGEELQLRAEQVKAITDNDTTKAIEVHDKRVECLKKALAELETCPGCDDHPKPKEEE